MRVLRCFTTTAEVGAGEQEELASESVARHDVPLAVYSELSDEERSRATITLRRVAGIAETKEQRVGGQSLARQIKLFRVPAITSPTMSTGPKFPPAMQSVAVKIFIKYSTNTNDRAWVTANFTKMQKLPPATREAATEEMKKIIAQAYSTNTMLTIHWPNVQLSRSASGSGDTFT